MTPAVLPKDFALNPAVATDHFWEKRGKIWKCLLCGGISLQKPPPLPTPADWSPDAFEELTDEERARARQRKR